MRELRDMSEDERAMLKHDAEKRVQGGPIVALIGAIMFIFAIALYLLMVSTGYIPPFWVIALLGILAFVVMAIGVLAKGTGEAELARFRTFESHQQPPPPSQQIKFCPNCGTNNPSGYNFCGQCQKLLP